MKLFKNYKVLVIACVIVVLCVGVGATLAFNNDVTDTLVNTFFPGDISAEITEDFNGEVKEHVKIKNTSERSKAYIRAYYVVTWKDANGNIYSQKPVAGEDYTYRMGSNGNWDFTTTDGYSYYALPIDPGASTPDFIRELKPVAGRAPAGYHLEVDIIAEAIQANPTSIVKSEWGVTVSSTGKISK
ncbi:MAG: hypothetical protein IJA55_05135 [Clostridia bacterium]|nr:hypothetical protein [Clostridia bacterium]